MKERRLVLTIAVGEAYQKIGEHTHPTLRRYADRIGADFLVIDESNCSTPHWEKFQICQLLNHYDRIIYLDTDIIVRDDCPDLFELVPKARLGAFEESALTGGRMVAMHEICKEYGETLQGWNGKYYNSGVLVISARHNQLFRKPGKETFSFYEQGYLNMQIALQKIQMYDLPYQFNRMGCIDAAIGEERVASYIIHYANSPSTVFMEHAIRNDLERWNADRPEYHYQRHILLFLRGGLGDQACAESAVRYMKENVYPNDDIIIITSFPRLFVHLNLPIFRPGEFVPKPDTPYLQMSSMGDVSKIQWGIISPLLSHSIDFCSIALLRRILPMDARRVRLEWSADDLSKIEEIVGAVNNLVIVHPGRHWETKSFPVSWWQAVIDGLDQSGLRVCIIGKEDDETGTVPVIAQNGVIDSRDRLDLGSLIALIANAPLLISNDSSPVHIAGAFDNHIICIPTVKHPEHILHIRHGSPYWKANAVYKRLMADDFDTRPTSGINGEVSVEFLPGDYKAYLPEAEEVVDLATEVMGNEQ